MTLHRTTDWQTVSALRESARALVFLSVPWSGPERHARQAFLEAATRLSADHHDLGIEFFILDEDADECRKLVSSLRIPGLTGEYSLGAGSVIWLARGQVTMYSVSGFEIGASGIIARTLTLWGEDKQPEPSP